MKKIIIRSQNSWWHCNWRELWEFRDLFYFFSWKDFKVKYKQTIIGVAWAIFQPFITMVVFTLFFGRLAGMPSENIPYPIFVYTGLLFWTLFSGALSAGSDVFIANSAMIGKIYFPRIILPVATIFTYLIDFAIALCILVVMMIYYQYLPSLMGILLMPLLILMTVISVLGISLFLASVNVKYRDVRYILPFFIQLLLFVTPVIYPASIAPEKYRWLLGINPMAGVIDTARAGLLGTKDIDYLLLSVSAIFMLIYFCVGFVYFKKTERYFADII